MEGLSLQRVLPRRPALLHAGNTGLGGARSCMSLHIGIVSNLHWIPTFVGPKEIQEEPRWQPFHENHASNPISTALGIVHCSYTIDCSAISMIKIVITRQEVSSR